MLDQLGNGIETICMMLLAGVFLRCLFNWNKTYYSDKPASMEEYLYKTARITGKSEYDIFLKSAEEWPISKIQIEEDFKAYLMGRSVPYYVRDFIRKNKRHIDELRIPRYY